MSRNISPFFVTGELCVMFQFQVTRLPSDEMRKKACCG